MSSDLRKAQRPYTQRTNDLRHLSWGRAFRMRGKKINSHHPKTSRDGPCVNELATVLYRPVRVGLASSVRSAPIPRRLGVGCPGAGIAARGLKVSWPFSTSTSMPQKPADCQMSRQTPLEPQTNLRTPHEVLLDQFVKNQKMLR